MTKWFEKLPLVAIGTLIWGGSLSAQGPDVVWSRTYGGAKEDRGHSVHQTSDSGYIVVGRTRSFGPGYPDIFLVKTDQNGDSLWTRRYGGSHWEWGNGVQQTYDGGYIIVGGTRSFGIATPARANVYLVKTNANGDTIWTKTYGGSGYERGYSVQQTSDGGYIVAAYTTSFGEGAESVWLLRADVNGDTNWTRTYGADTTLSRAYSVQQTSDGGYIVTGENTCVNADVYVIRTDSAGDTLWTRTYGGPDCDIGYSVRQTLDGGYVVAGCTYSFGTGTPDHCNFYVVKTDSTGDTLWTQTCGGDYDDHSYSVQQTSDGGYISTGYRDDSSSVYLVKIDVNGDTIWTKSFGGGGSEVGYSVEETVDGGYIIAGYTDSFGSGGYDVYLIKTAPDVGVEADVSVAKPLFICYARPNPFRCRTLIQYTLPRGSAVRLALYNLLGEEIKTLIDQDQDAGLHTVIWDATDGAGRKVSSGAYFLRLSTQSVESCRSRDGVGTGEAHRGLARRGCTGALKVCVVR